MSVSTAPLNLRYGRAALQLGFENPPEEYAISHDVDAVFWIGQAEELAASGNFWDAIDDLNKAYADQELYISHFFEEDQVVLQPDWKANRKWIEGPWKNLSLYRLGDEDLFFEQINERRPHRPIRRRVHRRTFKYDL